MTGEPAGLTSIFTPGETYRISVAPVDFFYRETQPVLTEFTPSHEPLKSLWLCENPMDTMRFTEYGKPVKLAADGNFAPPSGQGTFWLTDGVFAQVEPGKRHQLLVDLDSDQPDGDWCAWRVALRARGGRDLHHVQTVPGKPGTLRYIFTFTPPKNGEFPKSCDLIFNYPSPHSCLRVRRIELVVG